MQQALLNVYRSLITQIAFLGRTCFTNSLLNVNGSGGLGRREVRDRLKSEQKAFLGKHALFTDLLSQK